MNRCTTRQAFQLSILFLLLMTAGCKEKKEAVQMDFMSTIEAQMDTLQKNIDFAKDSIKFTPRSYTQGDLKLVDSEDWCSGFYPGTLWNLYGLTKNDKWKERAIAYTERLDSIQYLRGTHDLGFIMECSYGTALNYVASEAYENIIVQTAKTLSERFNPKVGAIKSWDWSDEWVYPVIIDNMINLEILFHATRITQDSSFYNIAISHADTTLKNHFREDNSSFHVVDYDPETGTVIKKNTHQGYADSSAWARGQAWGLYGYTLCYRETKDPKYLEQAIKIADYISGHPELPSDKIPYWDYDVPKTSSTTRDASAAAVSASALYELSGFVEDGGSQKHLALANQIMETLSTPAYLASEGTNGGFLLMHSTGDLPSDGEIDCGINYADYYFVEALLRKEKVAAQ
ncbi:glycoside hydrolase family 88 protein [Flagellimonas amoyensis]|uniref:glycoside hydrolase family 88 protein n=1 Tax=Flagellimonas amoyensis TaxID=2169401 RepID=UPI000D338EBE|nr:glycoside hydrolase family 88 protein [Allomuricauda amoyensis]